MPPDEIPGTAQEWLARSRGKLLFAKQSVPEGGYWEDPCNLLQQAAELAIKAVYQKHHWRFPFIHDLSELLEGLGEHGLEPPPAVQDADKLTPYGVQTRYPFMGAPLDQADYEEALRVAQAVVAWAESVVGA